MESTPPDVKYHKLATEYSKIRAQATVLKRALLEEQSKSSSLRESLRIKEASLRRAEQEVDSLGFRNKQLERRVASLQEDLDRDSKKCNKNSKSNKSKSNIEQNMVMSDPVFTEELQKKILENAQLASLIADKNSDIEMLANRITELEQQVSKNILNHTESERKLRKEIETLTTRNSSLETKLSDATSIVGSDDALSVSDSEHTPIHRNSISSDERIAHLEKELFHWKTKYEICKIAEIFDNELLSKASEKLVSNGPPCVGDTTSEACTSEIENENLSKEQLMFNYFSKKFEELFAEKSSAETKVTTYVIECESLQNNLEIMSNELNDKEQKYLESQRNWQMSEEDLATTRINYEEQISVLTEQVISLSEQLANLN